MHQPKGRALAGQVAGLVAALVLTTTAATAGQPPTGGPGHGHGHGRGMGMMGDAAHRADTQVFHALLDNRTKIRRTVTPRPDGVDTLTESDDPTLAKYIWTHVDAMAARVKEARPIHRRDPLFRAVFAHAHLIEVRHEPTPRGVRVIETSTDPYAVKLIQAHAEVVNRFLENGRAEMMLDHEVPARE